MTASRWGLLPLDEHHCSVRFDPQKGGWFAECSCGWKAKRASYYKARSAAWAKRHVERGAAMSVESGGNKKRPGSALTLRGRQQEVSPDATATLQPLQLAALELRQAVKNKAYRAFPLGQEAGAYLRRNRGRLRPNTYKTYESCLDKLARYFADLKLSDFEPPIGTERLLEFVDEQWGDSAARTQAKNISVLKGFFEWATLSGRLHGDPARPIRPPKKRGVERTTFSKDQERAIFAQNDRRDGLALHLLLKVGIRKGALQGVQFRHFDHAQKRLTVFTKGGKVQTVPIVDPAFWN